MTPTIFLDLDGVLVDFMGGVSRLLDRPLDPSMASAGIGAGFVLSNSAVWKRIDAAGVDFWSGLEPLPWCTEVYHLAAGHGDVAFLSSSGGYPNADAGKRLWLRQHFGQEIANRLVLVGAKHDKPRLSREGVILIDDHEETVLSWTAAGGRGILFPAAWNRKHQADPLADMRLSLAGSMS